jgi:hypothetical protein
LDGQAVWVEFLGVTVEGDDVLLSVSLLDHL